MSLFIVVAVNKTVREIDDISFVSIKGNAYRKAVAYVTAFENSSDERVGLIFRGIDDKYPLKVWTDSVHNLYTGCTWNSGEIHSSIYKIIADCIANILAWDVTEEYRFPVSYNVIESTDKEED